MTVKTRVAANPVMSVAIVLAILFIIGLVCFQLAVRSGDKQAEAPSTTPRLTKAVQRPLQQSRRQVVNLTARHTPKDHIRDTGTPPSDLAEQVQVPTVEVPLATPANRLEPESEDTDYDEKYDTLLDIYQRIDELGQQLGVARRQRASALTPVLSAIDGRTHVTQEEADEVMEELTEQRPMLDQVKATETDLWREYKALFHSIEDLVPGSVTTTYVDGPDIETYLDGLGISQSYGQNVTSMAQTAVDYEHIKSVLGSPPSDVDRRLADFFSTAGISTATATASLYIGGDTSESEERQ